LIDLILTGVIDGPLASGTPKAVEFYVVNDIPDLSIYGFSSANNGGGSAGQEYTFSGSARAGDYLYISTETNSFTSFFGFAPTDTAAAANINGDDAIELFQSGAVIDVFGMPDVDGTNQPWEYTDGWAYRQTHTTADGTFNRSQWRFSLPGALNGSTTNAGAAFPFPASSFSVLPIATPVVEAPESPEVDPPETESPETPEIVESTTITFISDIQGADNASPLVGTQVTVEAIVVGDFQGKNGLNGFYIQEEDCDADNTATTSEGLFIFDETLTDEALEVDVSVGDRVRVSGTVEERFDALTALTNISSISIIASDRTLPTPATINFPLATTGTLETAEGMRVTVPDTLYVTEYFNLDRFGELRLASDGPSNVPGTDGRIEQYTQFNTPSTGGFNAYQNLVARRQIILDDGSTQQTPDSLFGRGTRPLSATNPLRGGDSVTGLTGILSYDFNSYRIHTSQGVDFQPTNPRPPVPNEVGGSLKLASLNVLNFFTTLDQRNNPGSGPSNLPPRGADTAAEFERQLEKLVTVIATMDADIVGLVELENEFADTNGDSQFAAGTLVEALNKRMGSGTYVFVKPEQSFVDASDAISVGAIYKPETVRIAAGTTVETLTDDDIDGDEAIFDGASTNRAPLAVTFEEISSGETFTVAIAHFKSKGGSGTGDNADIGDGQGNFNGTRLRGAQTLATWLAGDPTTSSDEDFLIIGDLNAYAQEDPIIALEDIGYTDLARQFLGDKAYSFVFNGQFGTLDYALANETLRSQVTGATEWHINADEPDAIDYNLDFNRNPTLFDGRSPFRTSDHDPIVIGLELKSN